MLFVQKWKWYVFECVAWWEVIDTYISETWFLALTIGEELRILSQVPLGITISVQNRAFHSFDQTDNSLNSMNAFYKIMLISIEATLKALKYLLVWEPFLSVDKGERSIIQYRCKNTANMHLDNKQTLDSRQKHHIIQFRNHILHEGKVLQKTHHIWADIGLHVFPCR